MKKFKVIGLSIAIILVSFILLYIYNSFKTSTVVPPFFMSKVERNLNFLEDDIDYLYFRDRAKTTELHKGKINGSVDKVISENVGYKCNYSPDYTKIVFTEKDLVNRKTTIKVLSAETDEVLFEAVLDTPEVDLPRFSPDSKSLIYAASLKQDETTDIFIIDLDKKTNTSVCTVPTELKIGSAIWATNGQGFWVQYFYPLKRLTEYRKYDLKKKAFTVVTSRETDMDVISYRGVETYGSLTELPFETVQVDDYNNYAVRLKSDKRELIRYIPESAKIV